MYSAAAVCLPFHSILPLIRYLDIHNILYCSSGNHTPCVCIGLNRLSSCKKKECIKTRHINRNKTVRMKPPEPPQWPKQNDSNFWSKWNKTTWDTETAKANHRNYVESTKSDKTDCFDFWNIYFHQSMNIDQLGWIIYMYM